MVGFVPGAASDPCRRSQKPEVGPAALLAPAYSRV
jgi:hypothetical protein